ncbi:DNA alkylation repair protein [Cryobacterium melibiosiphilum]|uniref:DNA alkylation repair protein n=1 Tax=Cryobacterium melibiosiphilum TaxID=995039 RepID=A0A3A5MFN3_9MICO|nr:DNA alkylation repair protein [Cryobacterium melibiosiphilum]RJT88232.1 DNA alkylation repair protein [Cryobacterium melibiosiphilum]
MTDAGDFVDSTLRDEGSEYRAADDQERLHSDLRFYGASVGAVRGTVRDLARKYPGMSHDDITALSSELWREPVFERRLASVVLLQANVSRLIGTDLTRIEGFVRDARLAALVDPLAIDVIGPLREGLDRRDQVRADLALDRWARDDPWLARAALLSPLRALRAGAGDWPGFARRASVAGDSSVVTDVIDRVRSEVGASRPDLTA